MAGPRVSILIPAYNVEDCVAETVESVLDQNYDNLEIIIRDDGSTDGTWNLLKQFSRHVVLVKGTNIGPARGRNELFTLSTGEIVHFHDADDLLHPDYVRTILERFRQHRTTDVFLHNIKFVGNNQPEVQVTHDADLLARDPVGYALRVPIHLATITYRRRILDCQPVVFDHRFVYAEDWELNLRIVVFHRRIIACSDLLTTCRRRSGSFSRDGLSCTIAIVRMYCNFVNVIAPQARLDVSPWKQLLANKLYELGNSLSENGYPANAREAWDMAVHLQPSFDFGNRVLNFVSRLVGPDWAFLTWGVRRNVRKGLRTALSYAANSHSTPVRLG